MSVFHWGGNNWGSNSDEPMLEIDATEFAELRERREAQAGEMAAAAVAQQVEVAGWEEEMKRSQEERRGREQREREARMVCETHEQRVERLRHEWLHATCPHPGGFSRLWCQDCCELTPPDFEAGGVTESDMAAVGSASDAAGVTTEVQDSEPWSEAHPFQPWYVCAPMLGRDLAFGRADLLYPLRAHTKPHDADYGYGCCAGEHPKYCARKCHRCGQGPGKCLMSDYPPCDGWM